MTFPDQARRIQMADSHLTYIGSDRRSIPFNSTCYDVYPREGGHQLGWVYRTYGLWTAMSDDPTVQNVSAPTRWEAATALWGTYPAASDQEGQS